MRLVSEKALKHINPGEVVGAAGGSFQLRFTVKLYRKCKPLVELKNLVLGKV